MSAEQERAAIVAWLINRTLKVVDRPPIDWPQWRFALWGMLHPIKFAELHATVTTLGELIAAIESGAHRQAGE